MMPALPRAVRDRLVALVCALLVVLALVGCGGATRARDDNSVGAPDYLSDLHRRHYWPGAVVTYRFVAPEEATDIHGRPVRAVALREWQVAASQRAFVAWEAGLAENPPEARRLFVEVPYDVPADIDVLARPAADFEARIRAVYRLAAGRRHGDARGDRAAGGPCRGTVLARRSARERSRPDDDGPQFEQRGCHVPDGDRASAVVRARRQHGTGVVPAAFCHDRIGAIP